MAAKDPITCHVLDTLTGRPAVGVNVILSTSRDGSESVSFRGETNEDGRLTHWGYSSESDDTLETILKFVSKSDGTSIWKLTFDTGDYYGAGKTFWPTVELTFYVKHGEHYHVPLLLGPYSYTTYRGS